MQEYCLVDGTATDIHDQKVAEEQLAETQREFRFLTEFMPQLVWRADSNGSYDILINAGTIIRLKL
jgi:PAS domain-containing protein